MITVSWYSIDERPDRFNVRILDDIGAFGFGVDDFLKRIAGPKPVHLLINSCGGDAAGATKIFDAIFGRCPEVVIGKACLSAAVTLACAGERVQMQSDGLVMIHQPWRYVCGEESMLLRAAEQLAELTARDVEILTQRTEQPRELVESWLAPGRDTWWDAQEALKFGLVDEIYDPILPDGPAEPTLPPGPPEETVPCETDAEKLFWALTHALGPVAVADREKFFRHLSDWARLNITEVRHHQPVA